MKRTCLRKILSIALLIAAAGDCIAAETGNVRPGRPDGWNGAFFERIATFPVFENLDPDRGDEPASETAAEISAASEDGRFVYYSDSPKGRVGLIDIRRPRQPRPAGFIQLVGEPTSVAVSDRYLLIAVNTSPSFTEPSGKLSVYWIGDPLRPRWLADLDMGGQPDAIAVSPDGRYAAVAIENERDEDLNGGVMPQAPAGHLSVVEMRGWPMHWDVRRVDLSGYAAIAASDPEPEYVAINRANVAAVTLQENNHIVLVDLPRARVLGDFSAGSVDLDAVDILENGLIEPAGAIADRRREPGAIAWLNDWELVTANEGDYEDENGEEGGSRGFTLFKVDGQVRFDAGASLEHALIRAGHYPESRSENKGIEPKAVTTARFGGDNYLFVGSERGNIVAVYRTGIHGAPRLHQLLPTTPGPGGILAIPRRGLLVVSSEDDSAEEGFRSTVALYRYGRAAPDYPQIQSDPGALLPWGALSGMAGDRADAARVYAVADNDYAQSQIFQIDISGEPALIESAIALSKDGAPVDYDLEGIAQSGDGGFWLVSEGDGDSRPNLLIRAQGDGAVIEEIGLPEAVVEKQRRNGFEGVASAGSGDGERVLVAFQREWDGDPTRMVRIGVYTPASGDWAFYYYPLDAAVDGTWVGLSELTAIDADNFAVIERDNQQGDKARIKRLYRFSTAGLDPVAEGGEFPVLEKTLARDLMPHLRATRGWVPDKVEGAAIAADGEVYVVTDNDGVEGASGETRFLRLGRVFLSSGASRN